MTSAIIGNSVISIGNYAFQNCFLLTSVTFLGTTIPSIGINNFTISGDTAYYYSGTTNTLALSMFSNTVISPTPVAIVSSINTPAALGSAINNIAHTGVYATTVYAFNASGGFTMARGFDDIKFRDANAIPRFDVTDAVQVLFDVATFNAKLGLVKNAQNTVIVSSSFDKVNDYFASAGVEVASINLTSANLFAGLNVNGRQVISVGKYATLYSDFKNYVSSYFGFDGGFSSLFTAASEFAIDTNNQFNGASFVRLLNGEAVQPNGSYIADLSGNITVSNLTMLLRYAVDTNCFGNRTPSVDPSGSSVDPSYNSNYGVGDGFLAGDLFWIPSGTTITLKIAIDSEAFLPLNNVGTSFAATNYSQTTSYTGDNFTQTTTATTNLITRTVRAPLLIKLANASTIAAL
jgi:hypothetical protein